MFSLESTSLQDRSSALLYWVLPLLFFVTPLSSSAKSIVMGVSVALILATPRYRADVRALLSETWCWMTLLLFFMALVGCLWSPATVSEKGLVLEKWSKLLYLPLLAVAFQDAKVRRWALLAFLLSMLITCVTSLLMKYSGYWHTTRSISDYVFRNHIMTGIMVSFAAYLSGLFFREAHGSARGLFLFLGLFFSYHVLFVSEGRTGYVMYALLMSVFILHVFRGRQVLMGFVVMGALFLGCYSVSQPMQKGIQHLVDDLQSYQQNKDTPVGYRLQFHAYAKQRFKAHPVMGGGTGSFTYGFRTENPVPGWTADTEHSGRLLEPHSQYWLVAAEFGVVGLLVFALFHFGLLQAFYRLQTMRPIALALLLIVVVGNVSDSLLFYSGSGYFFLLFVALCLGENRSLSGNIPPNCVSS